MVEVNEPGCIVFCSFVTAMYDIGFSFYKVTEDSKIGDSELVHDRLEEIFANKLLDASKSPVKVSFVAKEKGLYKIIWSNEHSWFTTKDLEYRIVVLRPNEQEPANEIKK